MAAVHIFAASRYSKAEDLLAMVRKDMAEFAPVTKPDPNPFAASYTEMVAALVGRD